MSDVPFLDGNAMAVTCIDGLDSDCITAAASSDAVASQRRHGCDDTGAFPPVLDACCGSRMFWFDKHDSRALFVDKRREEYEIPPDAAYPNGSKIVIAPDLQADFSALPFPDESFALVVFDPPHFVRNTLAGINRKKYGCLSGDWQEMLSMGFSECFRVLKPDGTLIFKWAESSVSVSEILKLTQNKPLFGHQTRQHSKTHWITFLKDSERRSEVATGLAGTATSEAQCERGSKEHNRAGI